MSRTILATPDVAIVGQATIDDIYREDDDKRYLTTPGGDAVYATLGASMWSVAVGVVALVGEDYPKDKLEKATCNIERTDWSGIRYCAGPSIHDTAFYYRDGRREYTFEEPGLLDTLSAGPNDVPETMRSCKYVHIAPSNIQRQLALVRYFSENGATVSLDVESHFFVHDTEPLLRSLRAEPIFLPSIEHMRQLNGSSSANVAGMLRWLTSHGLKFAVVKRGSDGAWVFDTAARRVWQVGTVAELEIVDVTGAGDAFCGGFMAGLAITQDVVKAAAYGTVSASFIVETLGAVKPRKFNYGTAERRLKEVIATIKDIPIARVG